MSTKAGDRQIQQGREFKADAGSSPNGVANLWLKRHVGRRVRVQTSGVGRVMEGTLIAFDCYTILLDSVAEWNGPVLVFKGPGTMVGEAGESDAG